MTEEKKNVTFIVILAAITLLAIVIIILWAIIAHTLRDNGRCRRLLEQLIQDRGVDVRVVYLNDQNDGETAMMMMAGRPWDMYVVHDKDDRLFSDIVASGNLAMGESYMDGKWDCPRLDVMFAHLLRADMDSNAASNSLSQKFKLWCMRSMHAVVNLQSSRRAWEVGEKHYDTGNDLFEAMLDERMVYTCGYWERARNLDEAQRDKLELTCRKIGLHEHDASVHGPMVILDIGCGWGSFMEYAADRYGARVIGLTVSREQVRMGQERLRSRMPHLRGLVEYRLDDYREVLNKPEIYRGRFDAVVSLGMFEHVGQKNHAVFFDVAYVCLKPKGTFLLHTIGTNNPHGVPDRWIRRYVFPNGQLPALSDIAEQCESNERNMVVEDVQNFGNSYDRTLMAWNANFQRAWEMDAELRKKYGSRFKRMWEYYLQTCAAAFRTRRLQLYQCVLSKGGVPGGMYRRPGL